MNDKIIYICSFKFSPGLTKEFLLLGKKFQENNFMVKYILDKKYYNFINNKELNNTLFVSYGNNFLEIFKSLLYFPVNFSKIFYKIKNDNFSKRVFLFYNTHPINFVYQKFLKKYLNVYIISVLHEPYKRKKDLIKYSFIEFIVYFLINIIQKKIISISDKIVTVSPYGKNLFLTYYPKYKKKLISANLLLEDNLKIGINFKRKYFSFIGRINKAKGIFDFIKLVNYCINNNFYNYKFLIITSSNINYYKSLLNKDYKKILTIINKKEIYDYEIENIIKKSKAVLILHETASQSGVLPLAYKYKTPIIARNLIAFRQYIDNSGILLKNNFTPEELLNACKEIDKNFYYYSENAFNNFKRNFSENNFIKFYREIINI